MITFHPTNDEHLVTTLMTHPRIFEHAICGDGMDTMRPEDLSPPMQSYILRLVVKDDERTMGLLILVPLTSVCWEMHTYLLPAAWGFKSKRIFNALKEFIWNSTVNIKRVILIIPESNVPALRCAERNGLDHFGFNPDSVIRYGKLMGQHYYGLSRPEGV